MDQPFVNGRGKGARRWERGPKNGDSASVKVLWNLRAVSVLAPWRSEGKKALGASAVSPMTVARPRSGFPSLLL